MRLIIADNVFLFWAITIDVLGAVEFGNRTWVWQYDFHIRHVVCFRIFSECEGFMRRRGFIIALTSFAEENLGRRPNFYENEPPVVIRSGDYDSSWTLRPNSIWGEIKALLASLRQ